MSDIWVAPEFEGRGAGSLLIRALERQIADRGFAEAFIDVTAANGRALGLYRHLGYRDVWQRSEFDPILEATLEKIRLKKIFLALLRGGFSPRSQLALFTGNGMTPGIIIISST
ncbi:MULTISPECIES: N-acetyltransferase [unclassified Rhizobium]|uniref:GNAT family N-acetyltransferase n=2 Tax=Rhizobium TaxID=379 RepID=UPI002B23AD65|nr:MULTISPECIES: N-acetyltransferase [unclassified Rhizobium]